MTTAGFVAVLVMLLAGVGLVAAGILLLRRPDDWLASGMGVVLSVIGAGWLVTLIVAWIHRVDPFPLLASVIVAGLGLAAFAFWAILLAECVSQEEANSLDKLTWVIVILAANIVGALIYYFTRRTHGPEGRPNQSRE